MCVAPLSGINGASPTVPSNPRWHDLGYLAWSGAPIRMQKMILHFGCWSSMSNSAYGKGRCKIFFFYYFISK